MIVPATRYGTRVKERQKRPRSPRRTPSRLAGGHRREQAAAANESSNSKRRKVEALQQQRAKGGSTLEPGLRSTASLELHLHWRRPREPQPSANDLSTNAGLAGPEIEKTDLVFQSTYRRAPIEIGCIGNTTTSSREDAMVVCTCSRPNFIVQGFDAADSFVACQTTRWPAAMWSASGDSFRISIDSSIPCGWLAVKDEQDPPALARQLLAVV